MNASEMKIRTRLARLAMRAANFWLEVANKILGNEAEKADDQKVFNTPEELRAWLDKNGMRDVDVIVFDAPLKRPQGRWSKETLH